MTVTPVELDDADADVPPPVPAGRRSATWGLTWHGVRTVAALELRQRVRSTRWIVALVVWFVVVGGITALVTGALGALDEDAQNNGAIVFGAVTFLVLGLGLLVTPTLTSTAVNGDRAAGTLATLQVTLLTPAEIATGKLLAAWTSACAFLVVSLPFLLLALLLGSTPPTALLAAVLLVAALLAAVCGIGLGWSAVVARTAGSTVLTFVTVAGLTVFTPVLFGLTFPVVTQTEQVMVYGPPDGEWMGEDVPACERTERPREVSHTERTWWLLAANPFVVVADAAGSPSDPYVDEPLGAIREGVRDLRLGPPAERYECWWGQDSTPPPDPRDGANPSPVWPYGLAFNVLLGAGGFVVAVRRLRVPQRHLPRGTRVA